jgi:arylsulfatase A
VTQVVAMKNIIFLLLVAFFSVNVIAQKAAKQPNIILILADDLGYGDIGAYGQQKVKTPNLDRMAKEGMKFTQFYAGSTVCAPSRSALLTGQHTGRTPIRGNRGMKPEGQMPLPDTVTTFTQLLQKAGYKTAAFGKWGLGFITTTGDPKKQGFDEFYGYNCQTLAHNYYPDHLWHNYDRIELAANKVSDSIYSADLIHQQAMAFLSAKQDAPFFLYLPYTLPHADVVVPHDEVYEQYVKQFAEQPVAPPEDDKEGSHFDPYPHAAFAAMVTRLDSFVGEILQLLEKKGLAQNTLVLFTSDNGPHREKGGDPDFFNSGGGLRGIKRDLYEGGIRVPFLAWQKGAVKPGTTYAKPAALWDLYPTFLQLANVPVIKNIDGVSILPALQGKQVPEHRYFYWGLHEAGGKQAIRMGIWKGVRVNVSKDKDAPIELYNLATDPQEKNNIAARHPQIVAQIKKRMHEAYVPSADWPLLAGE